MSNGVKGKENEELCTNQR